MEAPELLNYIVCDCDDECAEQCKCTNYMQPCTAACPCQSHTDDLKGCQNPHKIAAFDETDDDFEDDE